LYLISITAGGNDASIKSPTSGTTVPGEKNKINKEGANKKEAKYSTFSSWSSPGIRREKRRRKGKGKKKKYL
jgi:hypothetical protein